MGLYKTKQRELIWDYLRDHGGHIAAEDIVEYLRGQGTSVGKSTVYRYLDRLVGEGTVRKFFLEEGMGACYQFVGDAGGCREHFHLKCLCCGKLFHIECDYLHEVQDHIFKSHRFFVDNTKTVLYGTCENCRATEETQSGENSDEKNED